MSHTSKAKIASDSSEDDRISALPDDVLRHVLGFLLADEAVRTCMLARRWRYLWKSMRCLHINCRSRQQENETVFLGSKFVNALLLLRDHSSTLDEVTMEVDSCEDLDTWTDIWIRHALSSQAQVLTVKPCFEVRDHCLDGAPLVSRHLRRLEFSFVTFRRNFLDFSSCTVLEELKMEECFLETSRIWSQSIKHMSMNECVFAEEDDCRIRISVPNLVSLQMISFRGRAPLLESMLSLETAVVSLENDERDACYESVAWECCGTCADCCGNDDHNGSCVLLGGLSCATNLELLAYGRMLIFRRDLRWCPTFRNLKTLLLTEWCVQVDLHPLVCMLEHSPVLENLTLQLCKQETTARKLEVGSLTEKPDAISPYLKIIKVEFEEYDDRVCKVLKFLNLFGTAIIIQRTIGDDDPASRGEEGEKLWGVDHSGPLGPFRTTLGCCPWEL